MSETLKYKDPIDLIYTSAQAVLREVNPVVVGHERFAQFPGIETRRFIEPGFERIYILNSDGYNNQSILEIRKLESLSEKPGFKNFFLGRNLNPADVLSQITQYKGNKYGVVVLARVRTVTGPVTFQQYYPNARRGLKDRFILGKSDGIKWVPTEKDIDIWNSLIVEQLNLLT